ncbi:MAG: hypothetical protein K0V04_19680 [Deltaproteobacteria bacterium]|nr:hypothetical protein [Deltaproteobacteria bacterium]
MKLGLVVLGLLVASGCRDAAQELGTGVDQTDSLLPPPDEPGAGLVPIGEPCVDSSNCMDPGICSAPWDGTPSPLVCASTCIRSGDDSKWCADDEACCDPDAQCGPRGLCTAAGAVDDTAGSTMGTSGGRTGESTASSTDSAGSGASSGLGTTDSAGSGASSGLGTDSAGTGGTSGGGASSTG